MTVSTDKAKEVFTGDGATTSFPVTFRIFNDDDVRVVVDGTTEVLNTDYQITNIDESSFIVDFSISSAPVNGAEIVVVRDLDIVQETDYLESDPFPAESHEAALDLLTMINQQQQEEIGRSLKASLAEGSIEDLPAPADRRGKFLTFTDDVNADPTAVGITDLGTGLVLDEDDFASNSAVDAPSQQSAAAFLTPRVNPSTDNAIARFDGTSGALQNSGATIDDSNNTNLSGGTLRGHGLPKVLISTATNLNNTTHRSAALDVRNQTLTIVANATTAYTVEQQALIYSTHASGGTLTAVAGVTLNGVDGGSATIAQFEGWGLYRDSTDDWILFNHTGVA